METNKIIEISGIADIYIRAICDIEDKYHEGDLVATLYSKPINFTFKPQIAEARKGINNLLSFYDRNLDSISIGNLSMTEKILELFQECELDKSFTITTRENKIPFNKEIYLNKSAEAETIVITGIDSSSIQYDAVNKIIYSEELSDEEEYEIIYKTKVQGKLFNMNKINYLPYFSVEVHYSGNSDKENKHTYFFIPRVKIQNMPIFNPPSSFEIEMKVIHDDEDVIQMGILNG